VLRLLFHLSSEFLEGLVPRKLLLALCAITVTAASIALGATNATAHRPDRYYACVLTNSYTRLYSDWCDRCNRCDYCDRCCNRCYDCAEPVRAGRAFRVLSQRGGYLLVRNLQTQGWVHLGHLQIVSQAYCRAAGI
jgi:hypothetical protein